MGIYPIAEAAPLTEEEKKNPYAHLYDLPIPDPAPELLEAFVPGNTMDPADAVPITELQKLFTPGALKKDNGYCMFPDGTCYSIVRVKQPDLTEEMERFWNDSHWLGQDDVHYKVWFPGMHFSHKDPVVENLGFGPGSIHFACPLILSELLTEAPEDLDPNFVGFTGCSGYFVPLDHLEDVWYQTIANCVRRCPEGGLEVQTINWAGIHLIDGKPVRMIPEDAQEDLEKARLMGCHNAWESTRKNQILPLVYEIYQGMES